MLSDLNAENWISSNARRKKIAFGVYIPYFFSLTNMLKLSESFISCEIVKYDLKIIFESLIRLLPAT